MFRYICWRCRHMIRNKIGRPGGSHSRDAHYHWATFALLQVILAPPHYYLAAVLVSTITYWCWSKICSSYYFFIYISLAYTFEVSGLTLSLMYIYCDLLRKAWFRSQLETCVYRKVGSSNTFHLEAHAGFLRLLMKEIFDPYVLWPFDKKLIS